MTDLRRSKNAILTILEALNVDFWNNFTLSMSKIPKNSKFRAAKMVKMTIFGSSKSEWQKNTDISTLCLEIRTQVWKIKNFLHSRFYVKSIEIFCTYLKRHFLGPEMDIFGSTFSSRKKSLSAPVNRNIHLRSCWSDKSWCISVKHCVCWNMFMLN